MQLHTRTYIIDWWESYDISYYIQIILLRSDQGKQIKGLTGALIAQRTSDEIQGL